MGSSQPTMCKLFPYWGTSFSPTSSVPWYITCSRQRSTALWKQHAPQLDVRLVVLPMSQHWIVVRIRCVCGVCVCVCVCVCCVCVCCMCIYMYVCGCCLCCRYMYMCMIWCCRYMFYGLLFLPCVKKMAVIIQFVHLANTSSICMHVCHVHMMCVWVMCYVFNYIQQSPKWSLTTTL